jgi:hypothetical protein
MGADHRPPPRRSCPDLKVQRYAALGSRHIAATRRANDSAFSRFRSLGSLGSPFLLNVIVAQLFSALSLYRIALQQTSSRTSPQCPTRVPVASRLMEALCLLAGAGFRSPAAQGAGANALRESGRTAAQTRALLRHPNFGIQAAGDHVPRFDTVVNVHVAWVGHSPAVSFRNTADSNADRGRVLDLEAPDRNTP